MNISNAGEYHDADFLWEDIATESRRALQEQVTPSWTHESADQYRLLHLVFSEPGLSEHYTGSQAQKNRPYSGSQAFQQTIGLLSRPQVEVIGALL
jgi:hypothetical protein